MKTAIYIEQGITQLVLTPENEWEINIVKQVSQGEQKCHIHRGGFYTCNGGWVRERQTENSLILVTGISPSE